MPAEGLFWNVFPYDYQWMICILISYTNIPGIACNFLSRKESGWKTIQGSYSIESALSKVTDDFIASSYGLTPPFSVTWHVWPEAPMQLLSSLCFQKPPAFFFQFLIPALPQVAGITVSSPLGTELRTPMSCSGFLLIRGRAWVSGCSSLCLDLPISVHGSKASPHCQSWWHFWCWEWSGEARGRASARVSPSSANSFPWADIALKIEANSFQLCPATPLAPMPHLSFRPSPLWNNLATHPRIWKPERSLTHGTGQKVPLLCHWF